MHSDSDGGRPDFGDRQGGPGQQFQQGGPGNGQLPQPPQGQQQGQQQDDGGSDS